MALEDSLLVIWVVDYTIIPLILSFAFYLLSKKLKYLLYFWHAVILRIISRREDNFGENAKGTILSGLHDVISSDWRLRNIGVIRILEINPGVGTCFRYFPKNCRLSVLEENPFICSQFEKNRKRYPEVRLEAYLKGGYEKLKIVPDCSVDCVISIGGLSSVTDVQGTLREIHRVLSPKGQFFYLEPTSHQPDTWRHNLQRIIDPVWYLLVGGHISRNLAQSIEQSHFSEVHQSKKLTPWSRKLNVILHPTLVGIATK